MSSIIRFDPFRDLDRLTEQMMSGGGRGSPRSFPMDAYRRGEQVFVHLDLPGVDADSIELTAENNMLTVSAERRFESEDQDQVVIQERPQGQFTRQLLLGDSLDVDRIEANYENGVLTLSIPVAEQAKPRRISVGRSGGQQTIEGTSRRTDESVAETSSN
jgi:HSP20 family protein